MLIARSRAVLEAGYMKGGRSRIASYEADSVRVAGELARRALEAYRQAEEQLKQTLLLRDAAKRR